jgi:tetratricopeptide (TPR) repeat protein
MALPPRGGSAMNQGVRVVTGCVVTAMWLVFGAGPAGAAGAGGSEGPLRSEDRDYTAAVRAIDAGNFAAAIPLLEAAIARDANNADAYNFLGYAVRRNGDPRRSIPIYEKALALDPRHRDAHEYIGEAYLALDDLPKARKHLAALDKLCFLPCGQYRDLKKAVEAYEKRAGPTPRAGR